MLPETASLEEVLAYLKEGTAKVKNIIEGRPESRVTGEQYMAFFTAVYNYSTRNPGRGHIYMRGMYREELVAYISSSVAPTLREKHGELMLRELAMKWADYKTLVRCLTRIFGHLNRDYISYQNYPTLAHVGLACFRDLVYAEVHGWARVAIVRLIEQEREGAQVDRALLKKAVEVFIEIGEGSLDHYEDDLEAAVLDGTAIYYSRKASRWLEEETCPSYMKRVEECLRKERDRVSHYLHAGTERKLLERARQELLAVQEARLLLEEEDSGCLALLRGGKVEDLSRMCRLFSMVPRGLEPIAQMFKQHVTDEGRALVTQAEEAEKKGEVPAKEESFLWKMIDLHDKYRVVYVDGCFQRRTLFRTALREALAVFYFQPKTVN